MTGRRSSYGESYWAGFERGVQSGHSIGYREGLSVLDDAWTELVRLRPWEAVDVAAARRRLAEQPVASLTPREMRTQAAESWGLPIPTDLTDPAEATAGGDAPADPANSVAVPVAEIDPATQVAELADEDDWAWQLLL